MRQMKYTESILIKRMIDFSFFIFFFYPKLQVPRASKWVFKKNFFFRGSTPQLEGSKCSIPEGLAPSDTPPVAPPGEFSEGHRHRISAEQLTRILREYSYMKKELRRLKELERERECAKGNER